MEKLYKTIFELKGKNEIRKKSIKITLTQKDIFPKKIFYTMGKAIKKDNKSKTKKIQKRQSFQ